MKKRIIKIGTRSSKLAIAQVNLVIKALKKTNTGRYKFEIVPIQTNGDRVSIGDEQNINIKGLFTKEIENSLLNGSIDIAVHSVKDIRANMESEFELISILKRSQRKDAFVSSKYKRLSRLPKGSKVGTSSVRRGEFLKSFYPNIEIIPIRGNVDTRLKIMNTSDLDGIILSYCGLQRLRILHKIKYIEKLDITSAIGQGAIGIQVLNSTDSDIKAICSKVNHIKSYNEISIEREIAKELNASCGTPIGVSVYYRKNFIRIEILYINHNTKKHYFISEKVNQDNLGSFIEESCLKIKALLSLI